MSESDLDDALSDLDLSDLTEGGDEPAAAEAAGDAGEDVELDGDLEAALADAGGGEGAEDVEFDGDLEAALADADVGEEDASGAEGMELDGDLEAALADAGGGGEEAADGDLGDLADALGGAEGGGDPAAAPAPAPALTGIPGAAALGIDEDAANVEFLLDIRLHVTFEVGRAKMLISDLLTLGQGSVVELHRLVGDELDFMVNGKLIAKGEVVVVNEKFGCRVTSIVPPEDRIKYLGGV